VSPFFISVITTVLAYIIGGLPSGYLFVLLSSGKDLRTLGSGNIGATNVHRTVGVRAGLVVLLIDILKGLFAVWLAGLLSHRDPLAIALAAVAVMLGHSYSVFLRFRGGKAVACFVGAFLLPAPVALAISLLIFIVVVTFTKYVSLGSIIAAALFPITVWLFDHPPQPIFIASIFAALLIVYRHQTNIFRLLHGEENVFSLKGGSP
jgi:glycerol-3-phosphate acyltransferase PlsY